MIVYLQNYSIFFGYYIPVISTKFCPVTHRFQKPEKSLQLSFLFEMSNEYPVRPRISYAGPSYPSRAFQGRQAGFTAFEREFGPPPCGKVYRFGIFAQVCQRCECRVVGVVGECPARAGHPNEQCPSAWAWNSTPARSPPCVLALSVPMSGGVDTHPCVCVSRVCVVVCTCVRCA